MTTKSMQRNAEFEDVVRHFRSSLKGMRGIVGLGTVLGKKGEQSFRVVISNDRKYDTIISQIPANYSGYSVKIERQGVPHLGEMVTS